VDPADLEVLERVCSEQSKILNDKTRVQNVEAIEAIKREGVTVLEISPEVENAFFKTGRAAWKDGVGRLYPEDLLDKVTAMVDSYRAEHEAAKTGK
jgi:TRAP-type C4-dicarboxylate transport system substrate-binding protein